MPSAMSNVISRKHDERQTETAFVDLLDNYCRQQNTIKPLSSNLYDRIEQLKAKAQNAKVIQPVI